ncbi:DUF4874 domain-containing protein [Nannocystis pusilla]|uniref:DUF4874 domain-containing protein n=1 Tax=Nannocystis pusilla TaxID=889268 RepID=A0A9X3F9A2_9BACT|nr:DUF4874 domain-containing protein [Nannocystis pusilla]
MLGALTSSACQGGDGSTDGATGAATDATTATAGPATDATTAASTDPTDGPADPTPTSSTSTTSGSTSVGTTDASTTTSDDPSATDTDTGSPGLACPLGEGSGVQQFALAPALFSAGDDPSDSPACAIVNPERGFHGFTNLRTLDGGILDNHAASGFSVVYGQVLLPEYRDAPLDADVLAEIAASFDLVREHGMKVVRAFTIPTRRTSPTPSSSGSSNTSSSLRRCCRSTPT